MCVCVYIYVYSVIFFLFKYLKRLSLKRNINDPFKQLLHSLLVVKGSLRRHVS